MSRSLKRVLITLGILLGLAALGPPVAAEALYRYELGKTGVPQKSTATPLPPNALAAFWVEAGERLPMESEAIWRWHFPLLPGRWSWPPVLAPGERMASLAARAWLWQRRDPTGGLRWQLAWAATTVWVSRNWSAEEMTTAWSSTAWYGREAHGLEAAAKAYFGRPAAALEPHQLALLVGLTQSPHRFDPDCWPDDARRRRHYILGRLLAEGVMSRTEHDAAVARPLDVVSRECRRE
jgi:hypothetical protein